MIVIASALALLAATWMRRSGAAMFARLAQKRVVS
jgi:hypothetical protein